MKIPNLKTREQIIKERRRNGEELIAILCDGMFGSLKHAPEYNDDYEIQKKALDDFKRHDFSEAGDYVDSLCQLVDYYRERAEHYLEILLQEGKYILDDNGWVEELE